MPHGSAARRTVLAAAVAAAAGATAGPALAAGAARHPDRRAPGGSSAQSGLVTLDTWVSHTDWRGGRHEGSWPATGGRPGVVLATPRGTAEYHDPHTGDTGRWEYATWTGPRRSPETPASELIVSWNAHTPAGTWIKAEVSARYPDGSDTPWYTMAIWTSGDGTDVPRRTSVDDQSDGTSSVSTDTLAIDDPDSGARFTSYRLRLTLYRAPDSNTGPTVWRASVLTSCLPDRYTVPASTPGQGAGVELGVPRYSQEIHKGQYPEYDNGGEAWCSPTSTQMILGFWGRNPTRDDLSWVDPSYADPQVCHAARYTFDYQYDGCGNWPFNTAYAATYRDLQAVVTRLDSLDDVERLVAAGIPLITSQSFTESELDGAGYGTAGHLMTVIGFTDSGDIIANDPNSPSNPEVRRVYNRRQFENIWLRTKRKDENGKEASGTGGVCYVLYPTDIGGEQRAALEGLGIV